MHYARLAAGTALIGGRLNVEVVQAYTLMMLYPVPCRRWEEDRTWIYLGLAIRSVFCYHAFPACQCFTPNADLTPHDPSLESPRLSISISLTP